MCEIFDVLFFTSKNPIRIDDSGTGEKIINCKIEPDFGILYCTHAALSLEHVSSTAVCPSPGRTVSVLQQPVLPLDVSVLQQPVLPMDVSVLQQPVLPLDVSVLQQPVLPMDVTFLQQTVLPLDVSVLQ
jgi:hypothetical protein